jgi:hypothetical protein
MTNIYRLRTQLLPCPNQKISKRHPPPGGDLNIGLFKLTHFESFPVVVEYTSADYADLLGTYSPQLSLQEEKRSAFLQEIRALIDKEFQGTTTKHYAMALAIAQKI